MLDTVTTLAPAIDSAPEWYRTSLASPGKSNFVEVDGVPIHYLSWGLEQAHKPGLVFIHGFRAHARWWDFIAPYFTERYRVVALDFSGMGDSGHRTAYEPMTFINDLAGVIEDANLAPATIIAHSFGGGRALRAAAEVPELIQHTILIDSYVQFCGEVLPQVQGPRTSAPPDPDLVRLLKNFRLMPPQPAALSYLVDHVARHSVRQVEGGWIWKFDRALPPQISEPNGQEILDRIETPVDVIYGEHSTIVSKERAERIAGRLKHGRSPICIPDGHHHVLLNKPLALVSALRALLA